ncbi:hypothetical protein ACPWML_25520, partial [Pandoraea pneumonica]|uniref:hypothetical protein n=1 Tax=Pandoraea pneumonica TaxID=2508299 RepID=UPI003CED9795
GFAAFLLALDGAAIPGLSFGIAERLSFDTLTVWTVAVGVAVLAGRGLTFSLREHTQSVVNL